LQLVVNLGMKDKWDYAKSLSMDWLQCYYGLDCYLKQLQKKLNLDDGTKIGLITNERSKYEGSKEQDYRLGFFNGKD
jgi:hypothetical protein